MRTALSLLTSFLLALAPSAAADGTAGPAEGPESGPSETEPTATSENGTQEPEPTPSAPEPEPEPSSHDRGTCILVSHLRICVPVNAGLSGGCPTGAQGFCRSAGPIYTSQGTFEPWACIDISGCPT